MFGKEFKPQSGMQMMLKSMGIDPAELDASIKGISNLAGSLDARLTAIERKLDRVLWFLETDYDINPTQIVSAEDAGITVTAIKE